MSLSTVTVTWNELDIGQAPLGGYVSFQLSAPAPDSADGLTIEPEPARTYFFTTGTGTSDPLVANDNAQLLAGSYYLVTVAINGQQPYTFKTLINHANGASQTLAFLYANQAQPAALFAQYLPLPSGTPSAGQVPVATGSGEASAWGSVSAGAVASVFGRTGAVVAQSGDYTAAQVGADASGAAAAAQAASLQKSSNLSDLANAATARTNLGLGSAATQNSSAFDASGAAAAAQAASDPLGSATAAAAYFLRVFAV